MVFATFCVLVFIFLLGGILVFIFLLGGPQINTTMKLLLLLRPLRRGEKGAFSLQFFEK